MHAIIPVAGKGTRLRPHTWSVPKALLPVAGRPILAHILDELIPVGIDRITLITGYLGNQIVEWASGAYDIEINFVVQERADGLASAVVLAEAWCDDSQTMVVLGDTVFRADLALLPASEKNLLGVKRVDDPQRFGVVVPDSEGRVVRLIEKPVDFISDLAIVGLYSFLSGDRLIDACRRLIESGRTSRGEFQLTDAMQLMVDEGEEFGTFDVEDWFDCGKAETMLETNRALLLRKPPDNTADGVRNSVIISPSYVASDVLAESSIIGPYASIGPGTVLEKSIVADSIIGSGSRIVSTLLEGSIIGNDAAVEGRPLALNTGDCSIIEF